MKKFAFIPLFAIALVAGCQDNQVGKQQPVEGAAADLTVPSFSASSGETVSLEGLSSVCVAYIEQRDALKVKVDQGTASVEAQEDLVMLDEYVTANCK